VLRRDQPPEPGDPSRVNPFYRYLNRALTAEHKVLLVGEAQPFDLEVPVLYNTCFDDCIFEQLLQAPERSARVAALREHGITHVYVSWSEIDRYRSPGNYGFTDFVTRSLVRQQLVDQQRVLRKIELGINPELGELFAVVDTNSPR
jgi:hypothetical protein